MEDLAKGSPPYLSYRTFRNYLESLSVGVPSRIDRSQMTTKNGTTQVLLLAALRYLGLISQKGLPSKELEQLVRAEGKSRQDLWRKILERSYPKFFNSAIDLERTTARELSEVFESDGVSSKDTVRKCVTFLSQAVKDAGIKLSPHVKAYAGVRSPKARGRSRADQLQPESDGSQAAAPTPVTSGSTKFEIILNKAPTLNPKWSPQEIQNWLMGVAGLRRIAEADNSGNGFGSPPDDLDSEG